jgi:DNA-binding CsgD family transcriptional regulator
LFFSLTYLFYNRLNYTFTSKSIISILQNDFERNSEEGEIYNTFNFFLWYKLDKIGIRNLEERFKSTSLQYFDKDFNLVDSDYRNLNNQVEYTPSDVPLFNYQIQKLKDNSVNILNYKLPVFENIYNKNHLNAKNTYIYPIILNNKIDGYVGICFSENLVELFNFYMKFNIGAILLFLAIIFIYTLLKKQPVKDDETLLNIFADKYGITNRESDIITYLLEGLSNKEIGEHLNISKRTVDNHIYNSLHKASAKNRVELINIIKNGL